jgi:hypothetical protein
MRVDTLPQGFVYSLRAAAKAAALFSLFSVDILTASLYNYIAIFEDTPSLASMYKLRKRSF